MRLVYFLLLFSIILCNYRLHKDLLHPIFLSCITWFLFPLFYEYLCITNDRYWVLSDKFYYYVSLYLIPFVLLSIVIIGDYKGKKKKDLIIKFSNTKYSYTTGIINFCIFCNIILIGRILLLCHTFSIIKAISVFRVITTEKRYLITSDILLLLYIFSITPPLCCYIFLSKIKIHRVKMLILLLEFVLITILYVSKGRIMKHFIMIFSILLLRKKMNLKTIIICLSFCFALVFFMTIIRDKNFMSSFSFWDYLYVYFLSPLPAFDMLINDFIPYETGPFGGRVLGFFYRLFSRLIGTPVPTYSKMFITIPAKVGRVPTNVYTCFGNTYMDFGAIGILMFGIFTAIIFSTSYKLSFYYNKVEFRIFYILIIYCLIFQFFGDFFFQFLSMPIQDFLCAILVVKMIKTRMIK